MSKRVTNESPIVKMSTTSTSVSTISPPTYPKMYILVNAELKMGKGKIAGQVGHGVATITRHVERTGRTSTYDKWCNGLEAKIVLNSTSTEMNSLWKKYMIGKDREVFCVPIFDAGKTQIPSGSFTVLAFCPLLAENTPLEITKMKLL